MNHPRDAFAASIDEGTNSPLPLARHQVIERDERLAFLWHVDGKAMRVVPIKVAA